MIRVALAASTIEVTPGTPVAVSLRVDNEGSSAVSTAIRVVGVDPSWVSGIDGPVVVDAGSAVEITLALAVPAGFPAGSQLLAVEVDDGTSAPIVRVPFELVVASLEGVSVALSPATFRGGFSGRFRINVVNRGRQPVTLKLSGRDEGSLEDRDGGLAYRFTPDEVSLRPGERARVNGKVRGRRPTVGAPRTRSVTVVAQSNSAPLHASGRFTQRPLLSRTLLRFIAIFIAVAVWAGALVSGVQVIQDRREETAAEAASSGDGGDDGAGVDGEAGEDGEGEDGAGGDGGEGEGAGEGGPEGTVTGATISGQVAGLTDRGGVRVDLRSVSLADSIPVETALASAGGKVLARTLALEPVGPVGAVVSTSTDGEGFWAFGGLDAPANYELTFSKAGFGAKTYVVSVKAEGDNVTLEAILAAGDGTIAGTVRGPEGALGGVSVSVTDGTVTFKTTTPTTGSGVGTWSVAGLATPGTYLVTAERNGYGTETTSVTLGAGDSRTGVELTLVPGVGSIGGTVTGNGHPLGGIMVTAASESVTRSVTSLTESPVGSFSLPQLPIPGSYTLTVAGDGWISQTQRIDLTGNADDITFELIATTATISGVVSDENGPLAAVGLTISQDEPVLKTLSAADPPGSFEASGLQPGSYVLLFERFGYESQSTIVEVAAGDHEVVDITLVEDTSASGEGSGIIRGIVRSGTTGDPIDGVAIDADGSTTTSDSEGSFLLDGLAAGSYEVTFTHARHQAITRVVRLAEAADATIDVTMLPFGGVQGQVTDLTATPLAGVSVSVTAATGTAAVTVPSVTTNAEGEYAMLESLPTGSYVLTFSKAGFQNRTREFEANAGTVATVDMTLLELSIIEGTIQEPAPGVTGGFALLNDVTIDLARLTGGAYATVQTLTVAAGEFRIENLPPGDYRITATKAGYGTVTKDLNDIKLREVRDGSVILTPGAQTVNGRTYWVDHANTRQPIAGATITTNAITGFRVLSVFPFVLPEFQTLTTTSAADGTWSLTGQTSGSSSNYTATAPGFLSRTISISAPQSSASTGDMQMTPVPRDIIGTFTLSPVVFGGTTDVSVLASLTGAPLSSPINESIVVRNNGSAGTYRFLGLTMPGTYTVTLSAGGYHDRSFAVVVPATTTALVVNPPATTIEKHSSMAVTVRSSVAANPLLAGVDVTLSGPSTDSATTTGTGTVSFSALRSGVYTITLEKNGFETQVITRSLAAGEDATVAATLLRFSSLTVELSRNENGTVTTGLSGATVVASKGGVDTPLSEIGNTGSYQVDSLAPGSYAVTASKALHDDATATLTMVAGTDYTQPLTLLAWPDLTVNVNSVFDLATTVLDDAVVTATRSGGTPVPLTETTNGVHATTSLQPGSYTITATSAGHDDASVSVTLAAGTDSSQTLDLLRWPDLDVSALDRFDGVTSALADAVVTATPTAGGAGARTLTGSGGSYSAPALAPGTYTVTATKAGYDDAAPVTVTATSGTSLAAQTLTLDRWPSFTLDVLSSLDAVTTPLVTSAVVTATRTSDSLIRTLTDADNDGSYIGTSMAPGTYAITVTAPGHDAAPAGADVVVVAGTSVASQSRTLLAWPTLTVEARSLLVIGGTTDTPGLEGATVIATHSDSTAVTLGGGTGGLYTTLSLRPGSYTVTATKTGTHADATPASVTSVAGSSLAIVTMDLARYPNLVVNTSSLDGASTTALDGAVVVATPSSGSPITLAATAGGVHTAAFIAPGSYTLTATKPADHNAAPTVGPITVTFGEAVSGSPFSMTLPRWPRLTLTITSSGGGTLTNVTATAVRLSAGVGSSRTTTTYAMTNVGGTWQTSTRVQPGTYVIDVTADNHNSATVPDFAAAAGAGTIASSIQLSQFSAVLLTLKERANNVETLFDGATSVKAYRLNGGQNSSRSNATAIDLHAVSGGSAGDWTISGSLSPAWYEFEGIGPTHVTSTVRAEAIAGSNLTTTLVLPKWPTVTVTVRGAVTLGTNTTYSALPSATVTATATTGGAAATFTHAGGGVFTSQFAPGTYTIDVSATGYSPTSYTGVVSTGGGAYITRNPDLAALTGTITGTVRKVDGTPLSGVTVSGQSSGVSIGTAVTTGNDGTYSFTGVAPVTWTMTYQKATYGPLTQSVTVGNGQTVTADAVLIELGGTITGMTTGQVSSEVANTGANALVALDSVSVVLDGPTDATQTVQSDGSGNFVYSFGGIPAGTYTLTFTRSDYQTVGPITVTLSPAQILTRNQTMTRTTGQVTVTGVRADNSTITESPQVGYTLSGPLISPSRTVTATNGVAVFTAVPPGTGYTVTVSTLPTGLVEVTAGAGSVGTVNDDGANTSYTETFAEVGAVSGTVTKDTGAGAVAAEAATVTLSGTTHQGVALTGFSMPTTAAGTYSFSSVPRSDGTGYTVTVSLTGFPDGTATGVAVTRGSTATVPTIALEEAGSLVITVSDDALAPIEAALVTITSGAFTDDALTDVSGQVTFTGLAAGTYTITSTKTGYFSGAGSKAVAIGQVTEPVTMDREATLTFTVTTTGGGAVPNASVTVSGIATPVDTDATGVATFLAVRSGSSVTYTVSKPSFTTVNGGPTTVTAPATDVPVTLT